MRTLPTDSKLFGKGLDDRKKIIQHIEWVQIIVYRRLAPSEKEFQVASIKRMVSDQGNATLRDWQTKWKCLPNGSLQHASGLTFHVVIDSKGEELHVNRASLETWETYELQHGLPLLNLAQRRQRLEWEAEEWQSRRRNHGPTHSVSMHCSG